MINDHVLKAIPLMKNYINFTLIITQNNECIGFKICVYFCRNSHRLSISGFRK